MRTTIGTAPSGPSRWPRVVGGAAVPLAVTGLAAGLWWISDRLGDVGPLDRAAFGWIVVLPVWIVAPAAAGFAWRGLDQRTTRAAAAVVGMVIAGLAALFLWRGVAFPACGTDALRTAQELVLPSLLVGVVVGGGVALSGLVSVRFAREGRLISAVTLGAACEALMIAAAVIVATGLILGPACQRP